MAEIPSLSLRGASLADHSPMPEYIAEHFERSADADPSDPDRYIGLAIAENKLVWDLLEPKLTSDRNVDQRTVGYDAMVGSERFRASIAAFGSEHLWGRAVHADEIITLAGAGSILETIFYVIGDPGDGVLIPTPSYAGFWMDIETRDAMRVVPAHMSPDEGFVIDVDVLARTYDETDIPIKALLLTNPSNPTGRIHTPDEMRGAVSWARSQGLHIIVNEIYGLSAHGSVPFIPTGSLVDVDDDIHFVWAFSKDLAMSGLRCGVLATSNEGLRTAIAGLAYWAVVSGDTQHLLGAMLDDRAWALDYLTGMRARLAEASRTATDALDRAGIPIVPGDAGLFRLLDVRAFLSEPSWDAEQTFWRTILHDANVNLTPGAACHVGEPGFMRLCFAEEPPDVVQIAIERIAGVLEP